MSRVFYKLDEALELIKQTGSAKFDETVDVAINLGVNAKKSDQNVRGATVLPRGTGRTMRVAVFAEGADADAAREAGADLVGLEDLAEQVQGGDIEFDVCIATPSTMRVVGKLGQILGPRGLMPNPKVGTVTQDVTESGNQRQGWTGSVSNRQGRYCSLPNRQGFFRSRGSERKSGCATGCSESGKTVFSQRAVYQAGNAVNDHGSRRQGG